jgi:hypothetical protein
VAVSGTHVASVYTGVDGTSFSTNSYTPTADRLMIAYVGNTKSGTPDTPTLSGNGLTWDQLVTYQPDTSGTQRRMTIFVAKSASPSAGAVTASFGGVSQAGCAIIVDEFAGVDLTGTALAAIVQNKTGSTTGSSTSEVITLDNAIGSGNATYGAFMHQADEATNPGTGYTQLGTGTFTSPVESHLSEYRVDGNITVDASWASSIQKGGIAAELKAEGAGGGPSTSAVWIQ